MQEKRLSLEQLAKIPLDIGLMTEEGYPHKGHLNYVSPEVDPTTGTIQVRGLFNNPNRDLLPGFFVRVRVPVAGFRIVLGRPRAYMAKADSGIAPPIANTIVNVEIRKTAPIMRSLSSY